MDYFLQQEKDEETTKESIRQQALLRLAYQRVFGFRTEGATKQDGIMVFKDLMTKCMTFQQTMTGNAWTYHNEGKRLIGGMIMESCGVTLDVLIDETRRRNNE